MDIFLCNEVYMYFIVYSVYSRNKFWDFNFLFKIVLYFINCVVSDKISFFREKKLYYKIGFLYVFKNILYFNYFY